MRHGLPSLYPVPYFNFYHSKNKGASLFALIELYLVSLDEAEQG